MFKTYNININAGVETENILNGTYTVTLSSLGYDPTTINTSSLVIDYEHNIYNLTISETGKLVIHVTEDGTFGGVEIVGATFIRCDSAGNTYGNVVTTNENGEVLIDN